MGQIVKGQAESPKKRFTSWKKGQSGNPKGGPDKLWTWRELCRDAMDEVDPNSGRQWKKIVVEKAREKAAGGDMSATAHFADRIDGKAPQGIGGYDDDGKFKEQSINIHFISPEEKL